MTADAKTVTVMESHPNFKTVTVTVIWGKLILKNNKTAGNIFDSNGTVLWVRQSSPGFAKVRVKVRACFWYVLEPT